MILVTGASGKVGRAVLDEVQKSRKPFKAMYRSAEDARKAPQGVITAVADFADRESLQQALVDVQTVYLVCSPVPELVQLESNVIDASVKGSVRHVVLNSALGAEDYPKSFPSWHRQVEDILKASGLSYTIFRPNGFMQNILAYNAPSIRAESAFYSAMGEARTSFLDIRDIAAVVAQALISPDEHSGKVYELNGPEAISNAGLAERISRVAGRPVKYIDIPETEQRKAMLGMDMPEWQITALLDLQRYYTGGQGGEITDVLPRLLGHPPTTIDQFLAEFKDQFNSQPASA